MEAPLLNPADIRSAFSRPLGPFSSINGYRSRLAAVLVGLIVLQALYLLLVAAVAVISGLYAIGATGLVLGTHSVNVVTILIAIGPPIAGLIATIFLVKPSVIRPPRPPKLLQLNAESEPIFFEYITCLCRALGATTPSRIFVDLRVNASASLRGWRGFFLGHLDLTIGLPLATTLSLPQFSGVLAHEFGHFTQRTGMRLHYLIQKIQHWFARVVHQRDGMDQWLDRQLRRRDLRIKAVAFVANLAVRANRAYLAFLMKLGARISSAFSRQMEFDADRKVVALVGLAPFEQILRDLPLLNFGVQQAWQDVAQHWAVGRLPDDFVDPVKLETNSIPPSVAALISESASAAKTGRWDTHPCLLDRIINARLCALQGVFTLPGLTKSLFQDLPDLCRRASLYHYQNVLKAHKAAILFPTRQAMAGVARDRAYEKAVQQLFHCCGGSGDSCAFSNREGSRETRRHTLPDPIRRQFTPDAVRPIRTVRRAPACAHR